MAGRNPKYSGQIVKVTGEGEHVTLAFTAGTVKELREAVGVVGAVAAERVKVNNDAVLDAASTFEQRQVQVYSNAVAQLRQEFNLTALAARRRDEFSCRRSRRAATRANGSVTWH